MISGRRQGSLLSSGFSPGASAKNIMARSWGRLQAQGSPTAIDGLSGAQSTVFTRLGLGAPQSSELRPGAQDYFGAFVCVVFAGTLVKSFLFSCLPRMAPASLLGFSPVSSHRGKKKKGHVCLERYVGQWNVSCTGAKGEEGSGGGEVRGRVELQCAPGHGPPPTCLCWAGGRLAGSFPSLTHFPDLLCSPWKKHRSFLPSSLCHPTRNSARQHPPDPGVSPAGLDLCRRFLGNCSG